MIEGITVLQTITTTITMPGFSVVGFIFALLALACIIVGFILDDPACFIGTIALTFVSVVFFKTAVEAPGPTRYQVLIDENVSITEFTEKYNIIEQQGITYIIEEKDNANS